MACVNRAVLFASYDRKDMHLSITKGAVIAHYGARILTEEEEV